MYAVSLFPPASVDMGLDANKHGIARNAYSQYISKHAFCVSGVGYRGVLWSGCVGP